MQNRLLNLYSDKKIKGTLAKHGAKKASKFIFWQKIKGTLAKHIEKKASKFIFWQKYKRNTGKTWCKKGF